ncbi:MAG: patatin-like phospholipase family protein [Pseudomonadales bacterium]
MRKPATTLAILGLTLLPVLAEASVVCPRQSVERPRIGLVLGGGGARGSAHIGVLQVLEELHVPVDYVVGTSFGALVGGLYATGMRASELEAVMLAIDWNQIFQDETPRKDWPAGRKINETRGLLGPRFGVGSSSNLITRGAISGQQISFLFETLVKGRVQQADFDHLPIPFRAVAADILTGDEFVLEKGNLPLAMRASMAVPGLFTPVDWEGTVLVDGGIANNVPIDVARKLGADVVIVVDVGSPLKTRDELNTAIGVVGQLTGLLVRNNVERQLATLKPRDQLIVPALGQEVTSADFDKAATGIAIGYAAADAARRSLARFSVSDAEYAEHRRIVESCTSRPETVDFVRLENRSRFSDSVLEELVTVEPGDTWDRNQLEFDLQQIYGLGFLEYARYEVAEEGDALGLILEVNQDNRGTRFLETGLDYQGEGSENSLSLRLGYLDTAFDDLGSEFRVTTQIGEEPGVVTDLYKYLGPRRRWFVQPGAFWLREDFNRYDDRGERVSRAEVERLGSMFSVGREIANHARISIGLEYVDGSVDGGTGVGDLQDFDFNSLEYGISAFYDRLDDLFVPGDGAAASVRYIYSDEDLGADDSYRQLRLNWLTARTWGRHTLMASARYNATLDGVAPLYARFGAGGFFRLSGFNDDELVGENFSMVLGGYRYRLPDSPFWPAFAGATLEFGGVSQRREDVYEDAFFNGSLYAGYQTFFGPLYFGWGMAEGGRERVFLRIGEIVGGKSRLRPAF